jgi:hypothetical protein
MFQWCLGSRSAKPNLARRATRVTGSARHAAGVRDCEAALHDDIGPVPAADVDARDLWVARAKTNVGEQLYRFPASKPLFR